MALMLCAAHGGIMNGRVSRSRLAISLLLAALLLFLTACSSWQQTHALSEPVARQAHYTQLRAELVGGQVVKVRDPWFSGDTLYGWPEAKPQPSSTKPELYGRSEGRPQESATPHEESDPVAIPVGQIAKLEARHLSAGKTVFGVLGVCVATIVVLFALSLASGDFYH
jgi:hypothetical protein